MSVLKQNSDFEKIFNAWRNIEEKKSREIICEMKQLKENCRYCFSLLTSLSDGYSTCYNVCSRSVIKELPVTAGFFKAIKEVSEEAYECISEGYDIINMQDYLEFKGKSIGEVSRVLSDMIEYCGYIRHALEKILAERDFERKRNLLKGLVGM